MSKGNEIIAINLDTSSDNSSSDSDNNTSEEIDYDSPEYKGSPKSLLKWYGYLSDEYKDKDRFWGSKSGGKEQASEASSKAKVQACGSKAKTFGVKIPPTMAYAEEKKRKRNISKGS
ncbi:hypothetical protein Tco_1512373 [Tanacetum coccineum]